MVLTLIADKPGIGAEEAGAAFGSPTIVHFSVALLLSALLHAPWQTTTMAAECWGVAGLGGLAYTVIVIGRMCRQPVYKPRFEDWLLHTAWPFLAYAMLSMSAFAALSHTHDALFGVGGAVLLLLFIGIPNAWDNVAYQVLVNIANAHRDRSRDDRE